MGSTPLHGPLWGTASVHLTGYLVPLGAHCWDFAPDHSLGLLCIERQDKNLALDAWKYRAQA